MKLLIFGATGSIGRQLVMQALAQGHLVTAFVRNATKANFTPHACLRIHEGDVLDQSSVERATKGQEVILCALGAGRQGTLRAAGTRHILQAMESTGVRRLIAQTTLGAGDSWANLNFFWKRIMFGMFLREAFADHQQQEAYIQQSRTDWTIVRPAAFTYGPQTGVYQHGFPASARELTATISRADVAHFMLKQIGEDTYLHQTPGLSY